MKGKSSLYPTAQVIVIKNIMTNVLLALIAIFTLLSSSTTVAQIPCPVRCRSCDNDVAECSQRSLTAPPKIYPAGTRIINLEGNHIRVIGSRSFRETESVEVLKISGNKILSLRNDAFSSFPNLMTLDLTDNRITTIYRRAFRNMDSLRTLSLNRNRIRSLSSIFRYVTNLYQLNLAKNNIRAIGPDDLSTLTRVHYLDFRNNRIESIHPRAFSGLQNLRYLFLNNNPLVNLPRFQFATEVLQLVDLSHCELTSVPGPFPSSVTDLRLGHNKIMQVNHTDFLNITDLQLLALNDNQLHFLADGTLSHLTQLQEVWLRGNNLVYIPRDLPNNVRKVHMDSNNIQQIEPGLFSNASYLDYLTVENNKVNRIHPNTFRGMRFLNTLNFQGNQLQVLETDTFVDLGSLSTMLLSSNPLRRIEAGAFRNLGNLTQLFLSYIVAEDFELEGNILPEMLRLQSLQLMNSPGLVDDLMAMIDDPAVTSVPLESLTQLDLSYNTLQWVSPRIRQVFPNLLSLPLDGNPLRCSQRLKWLRDWMVSTDVSFHNYNEIICETPSRLNGRTIRSIGDNEWAGDDEVDVGGSGVVTVQEDDTAVYPNEREGGFAQRDTSKVQAAGAAPPPQPFAMRAPGEGRGVGKRSEDERRGKGKGKGRKGKKHNRKNKDRKNRDKKGRKDRKNKKGNGKRRRKRDDGENDSDQIIKTAEQAREIGL